ncbi:hypothetical protein AVEN_271497-1 [Araneus ventricosus]|uniref:Uncharacterized protein n=1 Tax=Araneus ventricosus TaxID=182803 RepID=A0A4Y2IF07_ARAVE|nr:hypothetical protein AVEN_271497-1 [Araneus ventricosus]
MGVFCHLSLAFAFPIVFIFSNVDAENLRQRIFKGIDDGPCSFEQYRCLDNQCIPRNKLCNGRYDCVDNSDEGYCSTYSSDCPNHRAFFCGRSSSGLCIPMSWKCDGHKDCYNGEDEEPEQCGLSPGSAFSSCVMNFFFSIFFQKRPVSSQLKTFFGDGLNSGLGHKFFGPRLVRTRNFGVCSRKDNNEVS